MEDHRELHLIESGDEEFSSHDESCMYCCCFSKSAMPSCCIASFIQPPNGESPESVDTALSPDELVDFSEAARLIRTTGASMIKREAAAVNRSLLRVQKRSADTEKDETGPSSKKRKVEEKHLKDPTEDFQKVPDEQRLRIWDRVDRIRRMSLFLKNAQLAQRLLLQEMQECQDEQDQYLSSP